MNNIIFEKVWQDGDLIELKISCYSEFVSIYQMCYVDKEKLLESYIDITEYVKMPDKKCYIEFGEKEGNYSPAFSMRIFPIDLHGHMKIEVDFEIDDNDERAHRCCFYIESELGVLEQVARELKKIASI